MAEPIAAFATAQVGIMSQGRGGALRPGFRKARREKFAQFGPLVAFDWLDIAA